MVVMHLLWTSSVLGFRFPNTEDMDLDSMTNLGQYFTYSQPSSHRVRGQGQSKS